MTPEELDITHDNGTARQPRSKEAAEGEVEA